MEYPSSASVELISVTREENGRISKKRVIEKMKFDTSPVVNIALDTNGLVPPLNVNSPQDGAEEVAKQKACAASRSVSVSVLLSRHVTTHSYRAGQAHQMDSAMPEVSQRTVSSGSPPVSYPCMRWLWAACDLPLSGVLF